MSKFITIHGNAVSWLLSLDSIVAVNVHEMSDAWWVRVICRAEEVRDLYVYSDQSETKAITVFEQIRAELDPTFVPTVQEQSEFRIDGVPVSEAQYRQYVDILRNKQQLGVATDQITVQGQPEFRICDPKDPTPEGYKRVTGFTDDGKSFILYRSKP